MWDMTSLLSAVYESKLATSMYNKMESTVYTNRSVKDSTRRAFDSAMRADAAMYNQASRNMSDAMAMVEVAQSGTTAAKQYLNDMYKVATEAATLSGMSSDQYASYSASLNELAGLIVGLAENTSFNGMDLLNGTAGMNSDGTVVLQGGNSQIDQAFNNLIDSDLTEVMGANGNMNFNLLKDEATITDQSSAAAFAANLEKYIERLEMVEANYSYDIKGLENLSLLYEDRASILENTIQYKTLEEEESSTPSTSSFYLNDILNASNGSGTIFNQSS